MGRPRIVLAEDHPGVADELRRLLEAEFDVAAVVGDGHALLREAEIVAPDVIVTDVVMPGLDGIAATSALLARRPDARVVLVTVYDDPELARRGYEAGALAYVVKLNASSFPRSAPPCAASATPRGRRRSGDRVPTIRLAVSENGHEVAATRRWAPGRDARGRSSRYVTTDT
jgi:CheY-like chemotaxis protein